MSFYRKMATFTIAELTRTEDVLDENTSTDVVFLFAAPVMVLLLLEPIVELSSVFAVTTVTKSASGMAVLKFTVYCPVLGLVTLETLPLFWMVPGEVVPSKFTHARHAYRGAEPVAFSAVVICAAATLPVN
jgi:hypothetical protein